MARLVALLLAYFFLALAIVGVFLPLLPTVPFLLLAAWFAPRGSEQLHKWLYTHPYFGKTLTDWETQGAVSRRSKIISVFMLIASLFLIFYRLNNTWLLVSIAVVFIVIVAYLISRPEPD